MFFVLVVCVFVGIFIVGLPIAYGVIFSKAVDEPPDMPESDKSIIRAYAKHGTDREAAIAVYRKWIPKLGAKGTPEQRFMAEVDHPVPDAILRDMYRQDLLHR